jgi:hypothetical protein
MRQHTSEYDRETKDQVRYFVVCSVYISYTAFMCMYVCVVYVCVRLKSDIFLSTSLRSSPVM